MSKSNSHPPPTFEGINIYSASLHPNTSRMIECTNTCRSTINCQVYVILCFKNAMNGPMMQCSIQYRLHDYILVVMHAASSTTGGLPVLLMLNICTYVGINLRTLWACLSLPHMAYVTERHHRHSAVYDIVHRVLVAAHVPSCLELSGLYRSDGK